MAGCYCSCYCFTILQNSCNIWDLYIHAAIYTSQNNKVWSSICDCHNTWQACCELTDYNVANNLSYKNGYKWGETTALLFLTMKNLSELYKLGNPYQPTVLSLKTILHITWNRKHVVYLTFKGSFALPCFTNLPICIEFQKNCFVFQYVCTVKR
jgi:hypothetical protein